MAPYGRLLNIHELDQGDRGSAGFLGPRTEQFSLGSLFYLMNYGFEVYGDRCLTDDPHEHGPKVVDLLQKMKFPELDVDPFIDNIIDKCWHNKYVTVSELAAQTEAFLNGRIDTVESNEARIHRKAPIAGRIDGDNSHVDQNCVEEEWLWKKKYCQDLGQRGILDLLGSEVPKKLVQDFVGKVESPGLVPIPAEANPRKL